MFKVWEPVFACPGIALAAPKAQHRAIWQSQAALVLLKASPQA
jgi:hypothetical protein